MDRRKFSIGLPVALSLAAPSAHALRLAESDEGQPKGPDRLYTDEEREREYENLLRYYENEMARSNLQLSPLASSDELSSSLDESYLVDGMATAVARGWTEEMERLFAAAGGYHLLEQDKPEIVWPDDEFNPDYRHLGEFTLPSDEGFELNSKILEDLARRNHFRFPSNNPSGVRLFGLRGCVIDGFDPTSNCRSENAYKDFSLTQRLRLVRPDHLTASCTLGVWRESDGAIALFSGSTVPEASYMYASASAKGASCSLLPTGFYRYAIGPHNGYPRCLRKAPISVEPYLVLRAVGVLSYNPFKESNYWANGAAHNIHFGNCSMSPFRPRTHGGHAFSYAKVNSAGCQTVKGIQSRTRTEDRNQNSPWFHFKRSARITGPDELPDGTAYHYMLLTGVEAALAYNSGPDYLSRYNRLRFGSSGSAVEALSQTLDQAFPGGVFGRRIRSGGAEFNRDLSFAVLMHRNVFGDDFGARSEYEYTSPIWLPEVDSVN